jgi:hypothetical protein
MQPSTSSSSNQHYHHMASTPSATSRVQQKQFFLNNYTTIPTQNNNNNNNDQNNTKMNPNIDCSLGYQPPAKIFRINSTPASATITSADQQPKKQSIAPLEFPIQISYNIDGNATSSTNSPTVKIDYSKLALPAASISTTTTMSPSIKIDLSHFTTPASASTSIQPSSNATTTMPTPSSSSSLCLDEDYDA